MKRMVHRTAALALALLTLQVGAASERLVTQKGRAFFPLKMTVKAGESVTFMNDDPFAHNVFSLSDAKSFDLGSYGQGQGKSVVLDKPGIVDVECAVHPDMKMQIEVRP